MNHFRTVTEAMEDLRQRGYKEDFSPAQDYLKVTGTDIKLRGEEFNVDEFHRFEGTSDPGDEMTVYAITATNGTKGIFVAPHTTYSTEISSELMAKFHITDRPEVNTEGSVKPLDSISSNQ